LNPKWAFIPSGVFRKGLKKSVRLSSTSLLIDCRLRHKPAFYEVINLNSTRKPPCHPKTGIVAVNSKNLTRQSGG
ncbi:MAG: hypothetical protein WAL98_17900, partial [Desulfatiglandaceae bacterium]